MLSHAYSLFCENKTKREERPESTKKGIILWCLKHSHLNKNPGSSSNLSVCFTPLLMKSLTFFIHCHRIDSKFHQGATSRLNHWALKLHMQSVWLPSWGLWAKPYCQFLGLTFLKTSLKLDSCRKRIKPPGEVNTPHPYPSWWPSSTGKHCKLHFSSQGRGRGDCYTLKTVRKSEMANSR